MFRLLWPRTSEKINGHLFYLFYLFSQEAKNKINKINKINGHLFCLFYLFYLFYFQASVTKDLGENKWPFILFILFIFSGS